MPTSRFSQTHSLTSPQSPTTITVSPNPTQDISSQLFLDLDFPPLPSPSPQCPIQPHHPMLTRHQLKQNPHRLIELHPHNTTNIALLLETTPVPVPKSCTLLDGSIIAVKQLSAKSKQGNREFVNEIGMISGLQHPNLVRLYGCCVERNQLLLVQRMED
ncbi:hypothetical protein FEM48_Zijuj01G0052300 [Ziziphus jujuba var. spinosa]|uniref:Serine-threonine/tyrosine-protein kinase catalytic domain-containing protein n=1 Tax=Ziziphus jujuba var. spinosa TaxID=714518 RepID=A0A978VZB7_ZIZJJ|nr:hypothetical protein FEM48_Zijuj01G0052300 [Ziziphus jujuba var. spinosa]